MQREMILFKQVLDKISDFSRPLDKDTLSPSCSEKNSRVHQVMEVSFWCNHKL